MGSKRYMPVLIIGGFLLFCLYQLNRNTKELEKNHRYTIATITEREYGLTKAYIYFYFYYKKKKEDTFHQIGSNERRRSKVFNRFIVEFNPEDLDNNEILLNYPIEDDSLKAPIEGWLAIPDSIEEVPLKE